MSIPLDVPSVVAALDAGEDLIFRLFWGHHRRKDGRLTGACFSQWWPADFSIEGRTYTTAEQWMMASKARLFNDHELAERMMSEQDPRELKALGRRVRGFAQDAWDAACFDIVTEGNIAKFGQNPQLQRYLLETGDDILVEASPTDLVWGIGFSRDAPESKQPHQWRGRNLLGFALMRTRAVLRAKLDAP